MGRKKRRSSKFRDSSTVIDMEQARQDRQERLEKAEEKRSRKKRAGTRRSAVNVSASGQTGRKPVSVTAQEAADRMTGKAGELRDKAINAWEETREDTEILRETAPEEAARETEGEAGQGSSGSGPRQDRRKMALRRRKLRRSAMVGAALLVMLVILGFSLGHIFVLKHELHTAEKQQIEYQEEKEQLEKDLEEIDDLDYLEEQARDQMRLIRPGETLYIFPENMMEPEQEQATQE